MSSPDRNVRVCAAIDKQVANLLKSNAFLAWEKLPELRPTDANQSGDLIVFNNSYLHRETKSVKSNKYICVRVDKAGRPAIINPLKNRFNSDLTRIPGASTYQYQITPMPTAVAQELETLGSIVFALAGRIGQDEPAEAELRTGSQNLSALRFEPDQQDLAVVTQHEITLSRLDNIDAAWQAVSAAIDEQNLNKPQGFIDIFKRGFANLREEAGRRVDINDISADGPSIVSEIIEGLERQLDSYDGALSKHLAAPEDTEAYNEVMRIAYNFSEGATELISLIMGLSDLKPVVSWLTISAQASLAYQFRQLPLAGKEKPSIADYRSEVASARNSAFHDLFAFGRPFRVPLRSDAFRSAQLKLFRAYGRSAPALDYSDRELVSLLERFTRTDQVQAPVGFWEANVEVKRGACDAAKALRDALLVLA